MSPVAPVEPSGERGEPSREGGDPGREDGEPSGKAHQLVGIIPSCSWGLQLLLVSSPSGLLLRLQNIQEGRPWQGGAQSPALEVASWVVDPACVPGPFLQVQPELHWSPMQQT